MDRSSQVILLVLRIRIRKIVEAGVGSNGGALVGPSNLISVGDPEPIWCHWIYSVGDLNPKNCYQRWIRILAKQDPDHIKYGLWLPSNLISVVDPDPKSLLKPDLDQEFGSESQ